MFSELPDALGHASSIKPIQGGGFKRGLVILGGSLPPKHRPVALSLADYTIGLGGLVLIRLGVLVLVGLGGCSLVGMGGWALIGLGVLALIGLGVVALIGLGVLGFWGWAL